MTKSTRNLLLIGAVAVGAFFLLKKKSLAAELELPPTSSPSQSQTSGKPAPSKPKPTEQPISEPKTPELHYDGQREMTFVEDEYRWDSEEQYL